jgi:hypothetical protein
MLTEKVGYGSWAIQSAILTRDLITATIRIQESRHRQILEMDQVSGEKEKKGKISTSHESYLRFYLRILKTFRRF